MTDKVNRNAPCPCGSGKKYKNCCLDKEKSGTGSKFGMIGLALAIVLGLAFIAYSLAGDSGTQNCPDGMVWSEAHGHCH